MRYFFLISQKQYHIFVASGEGAAEYVMKSPLVDVFVDESPLSIERLAGRLISAPGWVTAAHLPNSPRVDGFYMLKKDPEYNVDSPPKFGLGVSTVKQRKAAKATKAAEALGSQKRAKTAPSTQNTQEGAHSSAGPSSVPSTQNTQEGAHSSAGPSSVPSTQNTQEGDHSSAGPSSVPSTQNTQEGVDLPSKSDVEMVDGVKENETALQAFGYQAFRKRFGEWKDAVEAVTSSEFAPYPEGLLACS